MSIFSISKYISSYSFILNDHECSFLNAYSISILLNMYVYIYQAIFDLFSRSLYLLILNIHVSFPFSIIYYFCENVI